MNNVEAIVNGKVTGPPWTSPKKSGSENPFYQEIRPIFIGLALCGKLPLTFTDDGKCTSMVRSWAFVYWLVNFTVLSVIACEQLYESWTFITMDGVDFNTIIEHGIIISTIIGLHAGVPFCIVHERRAIISLMDNWKSLIEHLEETMGEKFKTKKSTRYMKFLAIFDPFMVGAIVFLERNLFLQGKYWRAVFYLSIFLASHFHLLLWLFSFFTLGRISRKIERAIVVLSQGTPYTTNKALNMENLRELWLRLSILAQDTGSAMCFSMGTVAFSLLLVFIVAWFSVISSHINSDYEDRVDFLVVGLVTGSMLVVIIEPAHRVTETIGTSIMQVLNRIDRNKISPKLAEEVNTFIQTVSTNYPTITLGGLTVINRTWIPSIGASVITYLIVLVQFQASTHVNKN